MLGKTDKELRRGLVWETMIEHQLAMPEAAARMIPKLLFDRSDFYGK